MKIAGMVLGIIGGVIGLIVGFVGYGAAAVGDTFSQATGSSESYAIYKIVGLAAPIAAIAGGGMALQKPMLGGILLAVSAVLMAWVFGIGVFTIFPIALSAVGAALVFIGAKELTTSN